MGGGKETPRQKMIGLMYLVLMAMLAMNVSKEIINAFITIDGQMNAGNQLTREGVNLKITEANMALQEMKSTTKDPKKLAAQQDIIDKLGSIVTLSKETSNYLIGEASTMIVTSEEAAPELAKTLGGYDGSTHPALVDGQYYFTNDAGYHELASMNHITKKDDYDTPTNMFIGDNHKNMAEKGVALRTNLEKYRDDLVAMLSNYEETKGEKTIKYSFTPLTAKLETQDVEAIATFNAALDKSLETVNPKDKDKIRQIYKMLTYPEQVGNHDEMVPWQAGLFDHAPIVAAGAMFTSLRGDVQRAEAIAVNLMASKSEKPKFNFNKIDALAFSSKGYINSGDTLGLGVMIAAYDSTAKLKLRYWEDDSTRSGDPIPFESKSATKKLSLGKGKSAGKHFVYGDIEVEEDGGKKWKPWKFDYTIGSPTGTVANSEMNVLYRGYDNKIEASGSGYPKVEARCSGCSSWSGSGGTYIAGVKTGKEATITVTGTDDAGNNTQIAQKKFRIKSLPPPVALLLGNGPDKSTIKLGTLKQASVLKAALQGSPLDVPFTITKFTVECVVNGKVLDAKCTGNKFSGKAKNIVKGMKKGEKIYISNVYAKGPKGGAQKIPGLILKAI